jgi:NAD(P)-dependent dehydrogenase (short-subunit alcohol dehydrogenase family)
MNKTVFITGADRGLGFGLASGFLEKSWTVFAGQHMKNWSGLEDLQKSYPGSLHLVPLDVGSDKSVKEAAGKVRRATDSLDLIINNAAILERNSDIPITGNPDFGEMETILNINSVGPLRVAHALLPLMEHSGMKRLCFISSEAGSIASSKRMAWYGYCMSKAALNMAVKNMFNHLRPLGYSFRLYYPGWMRTYITGHLDRNANMDIHEAAAHAIYCFLDETIAEDELVLRDFEKKVWPW